MKGIDVAKKYLGLQEIRDRHVLKSFFVSEAIHNDIVIDPATTPWCAAFVNACERVAGRKGTGRLNARSFLKYGAPIDLNQAQEGDIVIFSRGSNGYSGHVTYFVAYEDSDDTIICLGGNQADMVNKAKYSCGRLLGIRRS